jgi:hypothetical protein
MDEEILLDIAARADAREGIRQGLEQSRKGLGQDAEKFFAEFEAAHGIIQLSIEGQRQIAAAILNPPAPTAALKRAATRYRDISSKA